MLNNFNDFKENLTIVNKNLITLEKPLKIDNSEVIIRDTMLLAPAGNRSLESVGKLYSIEKIPLTKEQINNMDVLIEENKSLFERYALQDALITLVHANHMEDFNFSLKKLGIPIILSSLGVNYVKNFWNEINYDGYQISNKFLLGNSSTTLTPKGLSATTEIGIKLPLFIANYKGGRNESFMYGRDEIII